MHMILWTCLWFAIPASPTPPASPGIEQEIEALARVIQSEVGDAIYSREERVAVAWVVRNRYWKRGRSIYAGLFPWRRQRGGDPPFTTTREPTDETMMLARDVLEAAPDRDPTDGSTAFFEPAMQDLACGRRRYYVLCADGIRERWRSRNEELREVVGHLELWAHRPRRPMVAEVAP